MRNIKRWTDILRIFIMNKIELTSGGLAMWKYKYNEKLWAACCPPDTHTITLCHILEKGAEILALIHIDDFIDSGNWIPITKEQYAVMNGPKSRITTRTDMKFGLGLGL